MSINIWTLAELFHAVYHCMYELNLNNEHELKEQI